MFNKMFLQNCPAATGKSVMPVKHPLLYLVSAVLFFTAFYMLYFSPALLETRVLAPGDGFNFYYPAVSAKWRLWEPGILAGYPVFADPQFLLWYPPRWVFRDYNTFIIFAYIAASSLTFGYVLWKSASVTAGLVAGITYGAGSFMVAHLGHASIIHAAAWLPLIIWSIDLLAERRTPGRFVIGVLAVALCLAGGHPQIFVYAMVLAGALALRHLFIIYPEGDRAAMILALTYAGMVGLAVSLYAVQLLPFIEFRELSARSESWTYAEFVSYSLPVRQLGMLFLPYVFGGGLNSPAAYFGAWNQTELASYAGLGTLILAVCAVLSRERNDGSAFWFAAGLVSLLLATAGSNYLGNLFFQIPIVGSFRATARASMVLTFATSVLAGMATARLQRGIVETRHVALASAVIGGLALVAAFSTIFSKRWLLKLQNAGVGAWSMTEYAILPPIVAVAAMTLLLLFWPRLTGRYLQSALIVAMVVGDVGIFGYYYEWRHAPFDKGLSTDLSKLAPDLAAPTSRVLAMPSVFVHDAFHPNRNLLYGIPSVSGYGPLEPKAYQDTTGIDSTGFVNEIPGPSLRRVLGLTNIVFNPRTLPDLQFGSCSAKAGDATVEIQLPVPIKATGIRVVSNMSCAVARRGGDAILTINVSTYEKDSRAVLLAGNHTSEWAYDRPDVKTAIQHARAPIATSYDAGGFTGHAYHATLPLTSSGAIDVRRIRLTFHGARGGMLSVQNLELVNSENGAVYPLDPAMLELEKSTSIRRINDDLFVANFKAKPNGLFWLVNKARAVSADVATQTVRSGMFPDGRPFDPDDTVLVEGPELDSTPSTQRGEVMSFSDGGTSLSLRVRAPSQSFLFLSRSYHPGWRAYVNEESVPLYRANGAFQGLAVPAGESYVTLTLRPTSLIIGGIISVVSLIVLGFALLAGLPSRSYGRF